MGQQPTASARAAPLCNVVLDRSIEENIRRLAPPGRAELRKLINPETPAAMQTKGDLLEDEGDYLLRFEVTGLSAEQISSRISEWLGEHKLVRWE